MHPIEVKLLSSLAKVFPDQLFDEQPFETGSALLGEVFSFQLAYRTPVLVKRLHLFLDAGPLQTGLDVFRVGLVPSEMPGYGDEDDFVLRTVSGLFPDPLYPVDESEELYGYPNQWRSLWFSIRIPESLREGIYPIHIRISGHDDSTFGYNRDWHGEAVFTLEILPAKLPKLTLPHTEWFSADCICSWYDLVPFSEKWWEIARNYIQNAADHNINMILTPIFTPPLETAVNAERPTIQLVDIRKEQDTYHFDFSRLERWLAMCRECGIQYFEIPHLFTQWGAKATPKIIIKENGVETKPFGWHTPSDSDTYLSFLSQFLPALASFMERAVGKDSVYFHISDEPGTDSAECYGRLSRFVKNLIGDYPIIDAMSSPEIFKTSALDLPVAATDELERFMESCSDPLWTYYACLQYKNGLANRFFALPSLRNRILGCQLYKYNIQGFLQWGYNHWYSGLSRKQINPFFVTDADACFPSGDAFLVYPGDTGPVNSIRIKVLAEAFQDYAALKYLDDLIGKKGTLEILEDSIPAVTMNDYPRDPCWLIHTRSRVNKEIAKLCK